MIPQKNLKVGVVQMTSTDSVADNLRAVENFIREGAAGGVGLLVFPENTLFMRLAPGSAILDLDLAGDESKKISNLSRELNIHVLMTTPTAGREGKSRNSTIHFAPGKPPEIVYSKIHLFDVDVEGAPSVRESDKFLSGEGPAVILVDGWRLGLSVCYDLRFAELYSHYAHKVDAILVPSAFLVPTGEAHWHVLLRARAIENQCYVLAPAQGGSHQSTSGVIRKTYGHSLIVDPWGRILSDRDGHPGVDIVELEPELLNQAQKQIPMRKHRRMLKE